MTLQLILFILSMTAVWLGAFVAGWGGAHIKFYRRVQSLMKENDVEWDMIRLDENAHQSDIWRNRGELDGIYKLINKMK